MGEAIARVADALRRINWENDDAWMSEYLPFRVRFNEDNEPELYWFVVDGYRIKKKRKIQDYGISIEDINTAKLLKQESQEIALSIINALYGKELSYRIRFSSGLIDSVPYQYSGVWHARARFLMETGYIECPWNGKRGLLLIEENSFRVRTHNQYAMSAAM